MALRAQKEGTEKEYAEHDIMRECIDGLIGAGNARFDFFLSCFYNPFGWNYIVKEMFQMDLASMLQTMLSSESIAKMGEKTGTSTDEVKSVLFSALPAMLNGVQGQACNQDTVAGFAGALDSHARDDTSDIAAFLSNVDLEDGGKIVGHLLGGDQAATMKAAADKAGLSTAATGSILGAAAPLLMSLLGQQATQTVQAQQASPSGSGLLAGLLGGAQQAPAPSGIAGLLGKLFGGGQQQGAAENPIGSMMGSMLGGTDITSLLSGFLGK
ncbi:MAG: DUF937 domain-containing protein [Oscillospiraceae bacterium]|nr:DUF937 domain-containing protein [Oscillospiraceae bacterium]